MLRYQKKPEPTVLAQARAQGLSSDDWDQGFRHKREVRDALRRDQGDLCAYCEAPIRVVGDDDVVMRIAHWHPRSRSGAA